MNRLKKYTWILILGLAALGLSSSAQDIHFSQFNSSPMTLNPALAGINGCDYRLVANFKSQWGSVSSGNTYRTIGASYDQAVGKTTRYSNYGGFGLSFFADQAGDGSFNTNQVDLNMSYHIMLDRTGNHSLSFGIHGGFIHRSVDITKLTFDEQFVDGVGLVRGVPVSENLTRERYFVGNIGAGALWNLNPTDRSNIYLGVGLTHLNQPNQSFLDDPDEKLYMKFTFHGGGMIPTSDKTAFLPSFMVLWQGPHTEYNVGTYFQIKPSSLPSNKTAFYIGAWYRVLDAVVAAARVDFNGVNIGFSYDINLSKLTVGSNANGGPEVSLIYSGCFNRKSVPTYCPVL